jgi:hypothetical protein
LNQRRRIIDQHTEQPVSALRLILTGHIAHE